MKNLFRVLVAILALLTFSAHAETANVAPNGTAYSNHPLWGPGNWNINMIIDGDKAAAVHGDTLTEPDADYTIDLGKDYPIQEVKISPRQDTCCPDRLANFRVSVNKDNAGAIGTEVWGTNLFTTGNAPSGPGTVVAVSIPNQIGRWIQIKSLANPVPDYSLQMSEVEVLADVPASEVNRALGSLASANRVLFGNASALNLVDGKKTTIAHGTNTQEAGFQYTVNLGTTVDLSKIVLWARQDGCCPERLSNYRVSVAKDDAGKPGQIVWKTDLHTDFSTVGADIGSKEVILPAADPTGTFSGQWLVIASLDDPVPDYALQLAEIEAYGVIAGSANVLITKQPSSVAVGVGQSANLTVAASVAGGDPTKLTYQWQKEGVIIPGATNASYATPPLLLADDGKKFRVVVSYPGAASATSDEAKVRLNLAYQTQAYSNRPLWAAGGWNISKLVNGDRTDAFHGDTDIASGMAYQVDLGAAVALTELDIYPRQDGCCPERLSNIRVSVHKDNAGQIGDQVWSTDLFTDGSNAGATAGAVVTLVATNGTGKFEGQWIQILSLDDPPINYAMQMTELEAYGTYSGGNPVLQIAQQPIDYGTVPGRTAKFQVTAKVVNGDPGKITYQWRKNGTNIVGATATNLVTGPLAESDAGAKYSVVISYPKAVDVVSTNAVLSFDYNYAKGQQAFSNRPLWGPGNWNISNVIDGDRLNVLHADVQPGAGFAYTINVGTVVAIDKIDIYPRQDTCCPERLANFRVSVHKDNNGQIGDSVWSTDLFTDGSNAGAGPGIVVEVTKDLDPAGKFEGQWVQIMALDDPVPDYFLQMTEVEVIGKEVPGATPPKLTFGIAGNSVTLSWPVITAGYTLESADALPSATWTAVTGVVNNSVTVNAATGKRFYRLKKP